MGGVPRDVRAAIRRRRILRLLLLVLLLITPAWGIWCWLLVTEYIIDYRGEEWSVGLYSVLLSLGLWAVFLLATVMTWRSLRPKRFE